MRCEASRSLSTMCLGVGPSGLPIDRSITSSPARRAFIFNSLVMLKTYGGSRLILENSRIVEFYGLGSPGPKQMAAFHILHVIPDARMHGLYGYREVIDTLQW